MTAVRLDRFWTWRLPRWEANAAGALPEEEHTATRAGPHNNFVTAVCLDQDETGGREVRQAPGDDPVALLKARLNAASDS